MSKPVDQRRVFKLNAKAIGSGPIVYWMSRDQRVTDNWSLLFAQQLSQEYKQPLIVVFCLTPTFLEATIRQYGFMLKGLREVEDQLNTLGIPFILLTGDPPKQVVSYSSKVAAGALITDFDPLKIKKQWQAEVNKDLGCAFFEVDAHNIVPCRLASPKQEFGAYTLRPKIKRELNEFLTEFPQLQKGTADLVEQYHQPTDWEGVVKTLKINFSVTEVSWCKPGEKAANTALKLFLKNRLSNYNEKRNDPTQDGTSNLSPYLHFGQLSAQRIALEVAATDAPESSKVAYLEELIIRKELSDNFCFYNENYDSTKGFPEWAKKTIKEHELDGRDVVYQLPELEHGQTDDELWNAAQLQMVKTGKMHGYMRMYWAKKILEWTTDHDDALKIAIYLNDKYELDGRDPNGYTGIAWSIGGVHDRAWFDRKIFGKIRYMSYGGCKSKFSVAEYVKRYKQI